MTKLSNISKMNPPKPQGIFCFSETCGACGYIWVPKYVVDCYFASPMQQTTMYYVRIVKHCVLQLVIFRAFAVWWNQHLATAITERGWWVQDGQQMPVVKLFEPLHCWIFAHCIANIWCINISLTCSESVMPPPAHESNIDASHLHVLPHGTLLI